MIEYKDFCYFCQDYKCIFSWLPWTTSRDQILCTVAKRKHLPTWLDEYRKLGYFTIQEG